MENDFYLSKILNEIESVKNKDDSKIGDKIRAISKLPEVQRRRAKLKAFHYLYEKGIGSFNLGFKVRKDNSVVVSLYESTGDGVSEKPIVLPPLSQYL
jgi:mRNA-degrading endonuclease RelE of RelBE toxin-antitoxin system